MENAVFAHSLRDQPIELWEPLSSHLAAVGDRAAEFAESFGWAHAARVAGRLHDIGKCSAAFQDYIRRGRGDGEPTRGPDHSTAGARVAATTYPGTLGRMLAYAIAGHHAGLCDSGNLEERLVGARLIEPYDGWEAHCGPLPQATALVSPLPARNPEAGFSLAFLARMLFSCLVDADFLETERFYAEAEGEPLCRGGFLDLAVLRDRLRGHMADRQASAEPSAMNSLRAEVLDHVVARADQPPGLFTLTVPTGGGKTLASLSFALEHALRHGLSRVVYVVPFTSIIEQTAQVFREALTTQDDILEHHARFVAPRKTGTRPSS
jgi:CRISPR-associated endonuclease/helicase Cas3